MSAIEYIMYGHARLAKTKRRKEEIYFSNIYSNAFGTQMCGDGNIYRLTFTPHRNQERDKEEVEYWGWLDNKGELSMVWGSYFLFDMCFPNGAETSEQAGQGKRIKLELLNFQDKW